MTPTALGRRAAAIMRHIAGTTPATAPTASRPQLLHRRTTTPAPLPAPVAEFGCDTCEVTWAGAEADCWSCGRPASHTHPGTTTRSVLLCLLHTTGLHTSCDPQPYAHR